jgi:hypothetical protein
MTEQEYERKMMAKMDEMFDAIYNRESDEDEHECMPDCELHFKEAVRKAVAAEREACAQVLDEMAAKDTLSNYYQVAALRIRERGAP